MRIDPNPKTGADSATPGVQRAADAANCADRQALGDQAKSSAPACQRHRARSAVHGVRHCTRRSGSSNRAGRARADHMRMLPSRPCGMERSPEPHATPTAAACGLVVSRALCAVFVVAGDGTPRGPKTRQTRWQLPRRRSRRAGRSGGRVRLSVHDLPTATHRACLLWRAVAHRSRASPPRGVAAARAAWGAQSRHGLYVPGRES